jgi:hypothetical protein
MRAATAVGATAILILVTEVWACTAGAEDAIKPGKWEFWTVGSKNPEPPPGTQLPPSMRWGPEGMITSVCFSETNLETPHSHVRTSMPRHGDLLRALKTRLGKGSCDLDTTTDATTATRSWSMNCAWSSGTLAPIVKALQNTLQGGGRPHMENQPRGALSLVRVVFHSCRA